jgi:hypothetical protein
VQAEARHRGAPWTGQSLHAFQIGLISRAGYAAPSIGAKCDSSR